MYDIITYDNKYTKSRNFCQVSYKPTRMYVKMEWSYEA